MGAADPLRDIQFLHVCYLTRQFDTARALLSSDLGAKSFIELGVIAILDERNEEVRMRLGLGYLGTSYVELIEPLSGPLDFYWESLRGATSPMIWHHCCYAVPSREQMRRIRALHERAGRAVAIASRSGDFFYIDTRTLCGHYTEYVLMDEQLIALHRTVREAAGAA
jgi:Glyoxalase/Bleomycin resistance protein/Dioxygenase superfamily